MTSQIPRGHPRATVLALDVDGVLLDTERAGKGRWDQVLKEKYGIDPTLLNDVFFQRSWSEVIVGREPVELALSRALVELGCDINVEDVLGCWFESDFEIDHEVVQAVNEWVETGIRVVLASNQETRRANFLGSNLGAYLPFEGIAYSGALGVLKSDPAFYAAAEHMLKIEAGTFKVVFVDDSLQNVEAAERHGWIGIHFDKQLDWHAEISTALAGPGH